MVLKAGEDTTSKAGGCSRVEVIASPGLVVAVDDNMKASYLSIPIFMSPLFSAVSKSNLLIFSFYNRTASNFLSRTLYHPLSRMMKTLVVEPKQAAWTLRPLLFIAVIFMPEKMEVMQT